MTTVLQRVANHLTCSRYVVAYIREDPEGGFVAFFDPHVLARDWKGALLFGKATFTFEEIREFTPTQILHRVREAEQRLLSDLGKTGVSLTFILLCVYPLAGIF